MIYRIIAAALFVLSSYSVQNPEVVTKSPVQTSKHIKTAIDESMYATLNANSFSMPSFDCFSKAILGFYKLKESGNVGKDFLTIVDYSLPSTEKRLWIIDTKENKIVMNSLVAHGKNSGQNYATSFSNKNESNKSSLGFFVTGETYNGKHGLSLRLDGLERGVNDGARNRSIVMHAADYVSDAFAKVHHRLGLSHGCPALPANLSAKIIATIKGKSCLFIYHPSMDYDKTNTLIS